MKYPKWLPKLYDNCPRCGGRERFIPTKTLDYAECTCGEQESSMSKDLAELLGLYAKKEKLRVLFWDRGRPMKLIFDRKKKGFQLITATFWGKLREL
jgi:hypothetical protein